MARRKRVPVDRRVKELLGFEPDADDRKVLAMWKAASTRVCKPCWELKYCPYGPIVEDFPLLPPTRAEAVEHNEYLKKLITRGRFDDGKPLDTERRSFFEQSVGEFRPEEYPESIPEEIADMSCRCFGHICPVVFSAEGFTETTDERRSGRTIPARILMRVARRDNYMCQVCSTPLRDAEIEFDHIIPIARGGSSEEHNLRVTCFKCNRQKGPSICL